MAKLNCPKCPDFDGFAMCTSQPLSKVASYEWCRKYLEGLEEVNGAAEELVILARSISIDVAIHNQLFSDKPVSGLDAIYPVRPEA